MRKEATKVSDGVPNAAFEHEEGDPSQSIPYPIPPPPSTNIASEVPPSSSALHEDEGGGCGWLSFHPPFLQRFTSSRWLLFGMCWAAAIQGMVINGFVNVCITTIEKRYNLKSSTAGFIAGSYDVGAVLCTIPVSYLGSLPGASKPRWIGWGLLIMGLGSFIFASPHILGPSYMPGGNSQDDSTTSVLLCLAQANVTSECSKVAVEWLSGYKYVFLAGQFLHGVGASPLYTLGVAYLDEIVPLKMSSFYLGIFHAMAVVGPAAGYVIGGQLLNRLFVDVQSTEPSRLGISRESDQWLGAWWVGFVLSGSMAVFLSWILMAFPARTPGSKKRAEDRSIAGGFANAKPTDSMGSLPEAMKLLLTNLPFVFICLAEATDGIVVSGFATFMPKIIENQFGVSAGFAGLLVGVLAVPAGGGGTFLGGWLVKRFRMGCRDILKFCTSISIVSFVLVFGFMKSCPEPLFAGGSVSYANRTMTLSKPLLASSCNSDCACKNSTFDPVCGTNQVTYYSPCFAGCQLKKNFSGQNIFDNCKCVGLDPAPFYTNASAIDPILDEESPSLPPLSASRQKCPPQCHFLSLFLILFFCIMLCTFVITMPATAATLRCVPDTHRSLALGLQGIQIRIFGTIPGPILFGTGMDGACVLWQQTCSGTGSCRLYSNALMSKYLNGLAALFKSVTFLFFALAWFFYRKKSKVVAHHEEGDQDKPNVKKINVFTIEDQNAKTSE